MRLSIQLNEDPDQLVSCELTASGRWDQTLEREVSKGDRIDFRVGADTDAASTSVDWDQTITYLRFDGGSRPTPGDLDPDINGLDETSYDAGSDFTPAGRPNAYVTVPRGGSVELSGVLEKEQTSDAVTPTVNHVRASEPGKTLHEDVEAAPVLADLTPDPSRQKTVVEDGDEWCLEYPDGTRLECQPSEEKAKARLGVLLPGETGLFRVAARFDVDEPAAEGDGLATRTASS